MLSLLLFRFDSWPWNAKGVAKKKKSKQLLEKYLVGVVVVRAEKIGV